MPHTRKSAQHQNPTFRGRHRFEHWYRDNQVYFITARCRGRSPAFATETAKAVFWDRFDHYTARYGFTPWVTSLLDNHYHTLGYLRRGDDLPGMMQRLHGSVAKLVNDTLPQRLTPFWKDKDHDNYMDGCLRDEKQGRATYRYVCGQAQRHEITHDWRLYPHTRINVAEDRAIRRALELNVFLTGVPYKRYERPR
ncbi:MAG: hypothetical protein AAF710_06330 [Planctomycetota bacterium]